MIHDSGVLQPLPSRVPKEISVQITKGDSIHTEKGEPQKLGALKLPYRNCKRLGCAAMQTRTSTLVYVPLRNSSITWCWDRRRSRL